MDLKHIYKNIFYNPDTKKYCFVNGYRQIVIDQPELLLMVYMIELLKSKK